MTANLKDAKMIKTWTKLCDVCLPWRPWSSWIRQEFGNMTFKSLYSLLLLKNNMNSKTRYEMKGARPTHSIEWIQKDILSTWTSILRPWDYALNTQVDGNCGEEHEKNTDVHRVRSTAAGVLTQSTQSTQSWILHSHLPLTLSYGNIWGSWQVSGINLVSKISFSSH